jgi:hypothetical protein
MKHKQQRDRFSYPIPASGRRGLLRSLLFGTFVTFFLWYFEPFGISANPFSVLEFLGFGLISFATFFGAHNVLPYLFPGIYREEHWTIYWQILFYLAITFVIATLNGLYINYLNSLSFSWSNYLQIITQTLAVGFLPITLFVLFSYYSMYKAIAERAQSLDRQLDRLFPTKKQHFTIQSHARQEELVLNTETFLFAKSSGNYVEVYLKQQPPKVYRMGLGDLEEQTVSSEHLVRCHRSYFVNMGQVQEVTGNAQGLKLWLKDLDAPLPVSRKYLAQVRAVFAQK